MIDLDQPCEEYAGARTKSGYGHRWDSIRKRVGRAHRIAWEHTNGPIPEGLKVLHACDNRVCINVAHLFLGTQQDNIADMVAKGRQARGGRLPQTKLSEQKVVEIRNLWEGGESQADLARRFSCSLMNINLIVRGKSRRNG